MTLSNFWKLENEVKKLNEKGCKILELCYNGKVSLWNDIFKQIKMNIKGILICFNINFEQKKSLDVAWFWLTTTKRHTISIQQYYYNICSECCKCNVK